MLDDYIKKHGMPIQAIWVDPDSLRHYYVLVVGAITTYSSLVDFGDYQREIDNSELRELDD